MKTRAVFFIAIIAIMAFSIGPVFAAKPADNFASAHTIPWNLSADVMPVPPYGSRDIPGSDTASKLIVNQPNGNVKMMLTGVMKGLTPNTMYTVYISQGYIPYIAETQYGDTWMPDLLTNTLQPFTFTTDEYGSASWHLNLRDNNFSGPGTHEISVWVNVAGLTMLISDTLSVTIS